MILNENEFFERPGATFNAVLVADEDKKTHSIQLIDDAEDLEAKLNLAQLVLALKYLHDNRVMYRDLKPNNILIDADGFIRLTDFGLSCMFKDGEEVKSTRFCGTPAYMAPEMVQRDEYGIEIDWWALGVVAYEMLNGTNPFARTSVEKTYEAIVNFTPVMKDTMDEDAKDLIQRLLEKDPKKRITVDDILKHPFITFENLGPS